MTCKFSAVLILVSSFTQRCPLESDSLKFKIHAIQSHIVPNAHHFWTIPGSLVIAWTTIPLIPAAASSHRRSFGDVFQSLQDGYSIKVCSHIFQILPSNIALDLRCGFARLCSGPHSRRRQPSVPAPVSPSWRRTTVVISAHRPRLGYHYVVSSIMIDIYFVFSTPMRYCPGKRERVVDYYWHWRGDSGYMLVSYSLKRACFINRCLDVLH